MAAAADAAATHECSAVDDPRHSGPIEHEWTNEQQAAAQDALGAAVSGRFGSELCSAIVALGAGLAPAHSWDVAYRNIDETALLTLEPAFPHMSQLRRLSLNNNPIGPGGAACLARCLAHTTALTSLCLNNTQLDESCMLVLAPAFARLSALTELLVHGNAVGTGLAQCIRHTPALELLGIQSTQLDAAAMSALASALVYVPRLVWMGMTHETQDVADVCRCLARAPALRKFAFYEGDDMDAYLSEADRVAIRAAAPAGCVITY